MFGSECKTALAVSLAENGTRACNRVSKPNSNGSTDYGIFQINSVHLKKGWTIEELKDCRKNIDYAYQIYQKQYFYPWVTYQRNLHLKHL